MSKEKEVETVEVVVIREDAKLNLAQTWDTLHDKLQRDESNFKNWGAQFSTHLNEIFSKYKGKALPKAQLIGEILHRLEIPFEEHKRMTELCNRWFDSVIGERGDKPYGSKKKVGTFLWADQTE